MIQQRCTFLLEIVADSNRSEVTLICGRVGGRPIERSTEAVVVT